MRIIRPTILLYILAILLSSAAFATSLTFAGIVGNSGGEGPTVVRSTVGRMGGGVVVDARGRIFTGGGDRILVLSRLGNLLWSTPLPKPDWVVGGPTFAIGGKYLYFIAGKPVRREGNYHFLWDPFTLVEPNLCRVEMAPGVQPAVLADAAALKWNAPWWNLEVSLTAAPGSETVYLGYTTASPANGTYTRDGYRVLEIKPDGTFATAFEAPFCGGRVSVDEAGNFYLGGGNTVRKYDRAWQPAPGFTPSELPKLGAVPSGYSGAVMLTKDNIWDMGHYGFIGRYTRDMKPNPGVVVQWAHAVSYVAQIVDAPDGGYYIKSDDALYLADIVDDRLQLRRRFGSLPEVYNLTLTPSGYIGVGNDARMLWFDFATDACAAAPVKCEYPGPIAQGMADGDVGALTCAINPGYVSRDYLPAPKGYALSRYAAEPFTAGSNHPEGRGTGEYDGRIDAIARVGNFYFALDGKNGRLARTLAAEPGKLSPIQQPLPGIPTSLAALANKYLLVAAGGSVQSFTVAADGILTPAWMLEANLGEEAYLAVSGNNLLLADTRRHRVLLFAFGATLDAPPTPVAIYGETDQPGNDFAHLDHPTLVSLSGSRAVVYDSGNQRVVKLRIR